MNRRSQSARGRQLAHRLGEQAHFGRTGLLGADDGTRALRGLEWAWDPDPTDDSFTVEYAFLLRDDDGVKSAHDRHVEGLFARATWQRILEGVGYRVEMINRPLNDHTVDEIFLCRRA